MSKDEDYQEYEQEVMDDDSTIYKGDTPSKQAELDEMKSEIETLKTMLKELASKITT